MRIGVLSDTHIPTRAQEIPAGILAEFKKVDMIIHAGDLVDLTVLEKLKSACANVKAVRGNMDSEEIKALLPEKEIIKIADYRVGVMHGYGKPGGLIDFLTAAFKKDAVDMIVFGHSHSGFNEKINGIIFFNPGSATDKICSPYNSYGIIEINDKIEAKIIRI
ncbi:MAG: metallophosphoesterase [Candidatus Omnitrophota bacterium]|nr:metallophosphoesterase [Candidatus Omnitrophota bacterium]